MYSSGMASSSAISRIGLSVCDMCGSGMMTRRCGSAAGPWTKGKRHAPGIAAFQADFRPVPRCHPEGTRAKSRSGREVCPRGYGIVTGPAICQPRSLAAGAAPFAKTGGLADVIGSLPKALSALGHDVRVVIPAYSFIEQKAQEGRQGLGPAPVTLRVPMGDGLIAAGVFESRLPGSDVPIYCVAERNLFDRQDLYGYWDDPYRFAFFSRAALDLVVAALGWRPDIVHAHDWHAAASIFWLATSGEWDDRYRGIPTVLTIHNLLHQGRAPWDILRYLGITTGSLAEEGFGEVNLLARAAFHATMVGTVSPTYAREIMTRDGGAGLD